VTPRDPPAALLLVHGAGSGPWIFDDWPPSFPGVAVHAADLQAGLDVSRASHADYAANVVGAAALLRRPLALCGWSMGGLVVMQAAAACQAHSVVVLEPSPPLEVQGLDETVQLEPGTFDPEEVYGAFPARTRARRESTLARRERKRGLSVSTLRCPSLVVYGDEFRDARGVAVARHYASSQFYFAGLDHWGLVRDRRVREAVAAYLGVRREEISST
jgi:pimeloyl-ACP methyl ester carboxylesterase